MVHTLYENLVLVSCFYKQPLSDILSDTSMYIVHLFANLASVWRSYILCLQLPFKSYSFSAPSHPHFRDTLEWFDPFSRSWICPYMHAMSSGVLLKLCITTLNFKPGKFNDEAQQTWKKVIILGQATFAKLRDLAYYRFHHVCLRLAILCNALISLLMIGSYVVYTMVNTSKACWACLIWSLKLQSRK